MSVSDEAVEAAAEATWFSANGSFFGVGWETASDVERDLWRSRARIALTAAAPYLFAATPAVRPLPTREQIAEATHARTEVHDWLSDDCPISCQEHYHDQAEAVLSLFTGGKE